MKVIPLVLCAAITATPLVAQGTPAPAPITWHALLLSSYQYDTHDPAGGAVPLRVFDSEHHAWRFDMAGLSLSRAAAPLGFQLDLVSGADAPVMASLGAPDPAFIDFTQAFVALKPAVAHGAEFHVGKFTTTAGAEVIPTWDNPNVTQSRSFLFGYAIPFTHTGIRVIVPLSPHLGATLGINRGWDKWKDNNHAPSFEGALSFTPDARWSVGFDTHQGPEQAGNTRNQRRLYDVVVSWQPSARWAFTFNVDRASEDGASTVTPGARATWSGWAGYAHRTLAAHWAVGARLERFDDPEGARTGVAQRLADGELTLDWAPQDHLLFRGDVRADHSDAAVFPLAAGAGSARSRTTVGFAVVLRR